MPLKGGKESLKALFWMIKRDRNLRRKRVTRTPHSPGKYENRDMIASYHSILLTKHAAELRTCSTKLSGREVRRIRATGEVRTCSTNLDFCALRSMNLGYVQGSGISVCTKETKETAIRSLSSDLLLPSDLIKS
jgi:hypothetical protein